MMVVIIPVASFVLFVLGILVVLRIRQPHSTRLANVQAEMNAKNPEKGQRTVTATTSPRDEPKKILEKLKETFTWEKMGLVVLLAIILGEGWYWSGVYIKNPPTMAAISSLWWKHWAAVGLILATLVASLGVIGLLIPKWQERMKQHQWVAVWVVLAMLFVLPALSWLLSGKAPSAAYAPKASIPLTSQSVDSWPKVMLPRGGRSANIPVPQQMRVTFDGEDVRIHCVYRDGHESSFVIGGNPCPSGDMPYVYVTNMRKADPNVVSYAYAQ
ncbi:MAG TPA: hypothetical protein VMV50_03180 [Candidatus Paceibacterota bacterium]|nr:hypothetical protein [Candidatus Paceibacterota bacterium]